MPRTVANLPRSGVPFHGCGSVQKAPLPVRNSHLPMLPSVTDVTVWQHTDELRFKARIGVSAGNTLDFGVYATQNRCMR